LGLPNVSADVVSASVAMAKKNSSSSSNCRSRGAADAFRDDPLRAHFAHRGKHTEPRSLHAAGGGRPQFRDDIAPCNAMLSPPSPR
jgi:hypothetical protein